MTLHILKRALLALSRMVWAGCIAGAAWAQGESGPTGGAAASRAAPEGTSAAAGSAPRSERAWVAVPRTWGTLRADQLGLVINTADPYSVEVGEYYARARRLRPDQILRVQLPVRAELTPAEFASLNQAIASRFGERIQALALAWTTPYAVGCNSLNGALAMGFDEKLCEQTCAKTRLSPYFNSGSNYPYTQMGLRPSMLLAARSVASAKAMIDRGVAADGTLVGRTRPWPHVYLVTTGDVVRSQRQMLFPPAGPVPALGVQVNLPNTEALTRASNVLIYETGRATVDGLDSVRFVPGALADHLTSFGGRLTDPLGQMSSLSWIEAGATASYGTSSEPCAHLQKFPHPQVLLLHYAQGSTALEAYWKSVAWPQQGVFIGEPLAAPFAAPSAAPAAAASGQTARAAE